MNTRNTKAFAYAAAREEGMNHEDAKAYAESFREGIASGLDRVESSKYALALTRKTSKTVADLLAEIPDAPELDEVTVQAIADDLASEIGAEMVGIG